MKRLFITMTVLLALTASAAKQKPLYRHDPQVVNNADIASGDEIAVYSDTTNAVLADTDSATVGTAANYGTTSGRTVDASITVKGVSDPFELIAYLLRIGGVGGVIIAALVVLLCLLTMLSPVFLLAIIMYFVMKSRNRKYRIIEKAIESGRPICGVGQAVVAR